VRTPSRQASCSLPWPGAVTLSPNSGPVKASNPIAKTMASTSYDAASVTMLSVVIVVMGSSRSETRETLGRLKVS
jgi:hypothetical protein